MEILVGVFSAVFMLAAAAATYYTWKVLNWVWFKPKRLEKRLRELGFNGNPYRFLYGDAKEFMKMAEEVMSKPMGFSNDVVPRILPYFQKCVTTYGQNSFVWLGPKPSVMVFDPVLIREVLTKLDTFQKPSNLLTEVVKGLNTYEGEKWANRRRMISPAFHLEKLKKMIPAFQECCCDMLSKWEEIVPMDGSSELDIWPYLQTFTREVISRTAFGSNYAEGEKIFELQNEQIQLGIQITNSVQFPGRRLLPTKTNRRVAEIRKQVESIILDIIDKRISKIKAGEPSSDDLLGILLESSYNEMQENGNGSGMTFRDVLEECRLFYFAGQDTTSSLLVWTMILLSKHLDWQTRAREEVLQSFGKEKPKFEDLSHLKVVTMILHEVLRLYPPGIAVTRVTRENCTLGKLKLPADVEIFLPVLQMNHDRKIWGEDATEFNPERFGEGVANATKGQLTYFPFGGGPRICMGQNFTMLEVKMAVVMILQNYSFELSPSYTHAPHLFMTLQPKHGAHLILRKHLQKRI